jgi:hypothetical protein
MSASALIDPEMVHVNRSELRQNQRAILRKAKGQTILVISASAPEDEKVVVDREYFENLIRKFRAAVETLAIAMDKPLFEGILNVAETLDEDMRLGKLRSFEEVFGEE